MVTGRDTMAQAVYLAQLEACRSSCKCNTCRVLRKASRMMTQEFLGGEGSSPLSQKGAANLEPDVRAEMLKLEDEEE